MTVAEIGDLVANELPERYEPLKLTFYGRSTRPNGEFAIFGDDYGTDLCVRISDGTVHSIDPQDKLPTCFVNSNIERLGKFIRVCISYSDRPKKECDALMWNELKSLDPEAFGNPENWWAQVREGSL